jgi:hypothetical protein
LELYEIQNLEAQFPSKIEGFVKASRYSQLTTVLDYGIALPAIALVGGSWKGK